MSNQPQKRTVIHLDPYKKRRDQMFDLLHKEGFSVVSLPSLYNKSLEDVDGTESEPLIFLVALSTDTSKIASGAHAFNKINDETEHHLIIAYATVNLEARARESGAKQFVLLEGDLSVLVNAVKQWT
ncbi:MAG: hypothetical protein AAB508_04500 [Patescibacteria group bacterium]